MARFEGFRSNTFGLDDRALDADVVVPGAFIAVLLREVGAPAVGSDEHVCVVIRGLQPVRVLAGAFG